MNMLVERVLSWPLVRTSLFVIGGGFMGAVGGVVVGLFIGGVIAVITPSYAGVTAGSVISGFLPTSMMMGALVSAVLAGVVSVKTTPSGDAMLMVDDGCCGDGSCEGCECCAEEAEEMIVVEAPQTDAQA